MWLCVQCSTKIMAGLRFTSQIVGKPWQKKITNPTYQKRKILTIPPKFPFPPFPILLALAKFSQTSPGATSRGGSWNKQPRGVKNFRSVFCIKREGPGQVKQTEGSLGGEATARGGAKLWMAGRGGRRPEIGAEGLGSEERKGGGHIVCSAAKSPGPCPGA